MRRSVWIAGGIDRIGNVEGQQLEIVDLALELNRVHPKLILPSRPYT